MSSYESGMTHVLLYLGSIVVVESSILISKVLYFPAIWNQLPIANISSETIATFHKQLKTYLFEIAFPP